MSEKKQGPRLAVDNTPEQKRRLLLAMERLKARNPKHTLDDVFAEVQVIKKEERGSDVDES